MNSPMFLGKAKKFKNPGKRSARSLVIEGINYWEKKDPGKWISSEVGDYVYNTYGVGVTNNYINTIRVSINMGFKQRCGRNFYNAVSQALALINPNKK